MITKQAINELVKESKDISDSLGKGKSDKNDTNAIDKSSPYRKKYVHTAEDDF